MFNVSDNIDAVGRGFDAMPAVVQAAVRDKIALVASALESRVRAKLSGEVLQTRSGALARSIASDVAGGGEETYARVFSQGVKYAAIQEYGGQTPPHEILPVKAKALAFMIGGKPVFAASVKHPGSRIPPRPYLQPALDEAAAEMTQTLGQAAVDAVRRQIGGAA
ncbi:MAG: hypothetical protein IIZ63_04475 [Caulobacteraceae bacterium]|nr:hypothetical protein [Caulobacteraceae bacterium]